MTARTALRLLAAAALAAFLSTCAWPLTGERMRLDRMVRETVFIKARWTQGSGVLVGPRTIITALHLFKSPITSVQITFSNGRTISGERIVAARKIDIAVIRLDKPANGIFATVVCRALKLDDPVIAIGNPVWMRWFVTHGTRGSLKKAEGINYPHVLLSLKTLPGSSGGPIFDRLGRLRAIVKAGLRYRGSPITGYTIATPSSAFCAVPDVRKQISRMIGI